MSRLQDVATKFGFRRGLVFRRWNGIVPGVGKSVATLDKGDMALDISKTPSRKVQAARARLDQRAEVPAVLQTPFAGLMIPCVNACGRLVTLALVNPRIDSQGPMKVRLRKVEPSIKVATWYALRRPSVRVPVQWQANGTAMVEIPALAAWNGGWLDLRRK